MSGKINCDCPHKGCCDGSCDKMTFVRSELKDMLVAYKGIKIRAVRVNGRDHPRSTFHEGFEKGLQTALAILSAEKVMDA